MTWLDSPGFERRPLVFVEDHLYHTGELLDALLAIRPDLLHHVSVCAIDREGPDTVAAVESWLTKYPGVQIAAAAPAGARVRTIGADDLASAAGFAKLLAGLLRPGGVLVQDVQLSTLAFVPADRWWESIYAAATVRGFFADRAPVVRFLSNKRGYAATFGRDLAEAGFDPRDVIDKAELVTAGVPAIASIFDRAFPLVIDARLGAAPKRAWPISDADREDVEAALDLVLWPSAQGIELGGRLVAGNDGRVIVRAGSHEGPTWEALVGDHLDARTGVLVIDIGERVGPADAERAELTNVAARHLHTMRSRLRDAGAIVTVQHAYRLADGLSAGILRRPSAGSVR